MVLGFEDGVHGHPNKRWAKFLNRKRSSALPGQARSTYQFETETNLVTADRLLSSLQKSDPSLFGRL
jgi:hypothetical protein